MPNHRLSIVLVASLLISALPSDAQAAAGASPGRQQTTAPKQIDRGALIKRLHHHLITGERTEHPTPMGGWTRPSAKAYGELIRKGVMSASPRVLQVIHDIVAASRVDKDNRILMNGSDSLLQIATVRSHLAQERTPAVLDTVVLWKYPSGGVSATLGTPFRPGK